MKTIIKLNIYFNKAIYGLSNLFLADILQKF